MKKIILFLFAFILLVNTASAAENASVELHVDRTNVSIGEEVKITLSLVTVITKPVMRFQIILKPPSGMSVTSKEFSQTAAGQYSYEDTVEPGKERPVIVNLKANEPGDFNVTGRVIYYFGGDISTAEDFSLSLPIKVRATPAPTETPKNGSTPDPIPKSRTNPWIFMGFIFFIFLFFVGYEFVKQKDKTAGIKGVNEIRNILLYFLILIAIAYGLTDLFADSRDVGYISTRSDISPNLQEFWFSLLALCFGAFYGNASVVAWFDWKKKFQSRSIILSSLIVAENFFKVITLRPLLFVIGLIIFAYLTHYFRNKEGEYIKYQASTFTIAVISILAVLLALLNYIFGRSDFVTSIWYSLLAVAFGAVILKFSIYEISNLKLFIVGPRDAGKTVFVSLLYEEALKQKITIGDVPENLVEPLGMLRKGRWPSSTVGVKPYDFRYVHGKSFAKEVKIDIDYCGELFEMEIDNITKYLKDKNANSSISPDGDVEKIADGIYNADKLIFIIDPERINSTDGSGDYITEYYMPILREIPDRLCYLLITKSDELYKDKPIDRNYEKFRKYITEQIEIEEPSYKDIKGRAKAVLPVFIDVKDDQPFISNGKLSFFGFDKVLDIIGK